MTPVLTPPLPVSLPAPAPVAPPVPPPPVVVQPPPPSVTQPQPFRWTFKEYCELDKTGFFNDRHAMLLDGVIYVMPNPKPPHSGALSVVNTWARGVFSTGHSVRVQMPFEIGGDSEPNPDLAVVTGSDRDYMTVNPTTAVLVVEVSDSTLFTDVTTKAEKYATAGVPDYWVIDLEHRELVVFRDPVPLPAGLGATAYRQRNTFGPDATVSPLAAPHASVKVADLLP